MPHLFLPFGRGLSLRLAVREGLEGLLDYFPAFGRRIFIMTLNVNREASRGLRSLVLEANSVSITGLFSLKHEDGARCGTYCGFLMAAI